MSSRLSISMVRSPKGQPRATIFVSNRGPVQFEISRHGLVACPGAGALAMTLRGLGSTEPAVFVSTAMSEGDLRAARGGTMQPENGLLARRSHAVRLIEHDPTDLGDAYDFCNSVLWAVHHSLDRTEITGLSDAVGKFAAYVTVNEVMAKAVLREASRWTNRDVVVRSHDYHLYLMSAALRVARPDLLLHHFIHVPWPCAETWLALPQQVRHSVCGGLLANDIVSFQTSRDADNFLSTISGMALHGVEADGSAVSCGGHVVRVTHNPVSVDVHRLRQSAATLAVRQATDVLRTELQLATGRTKIILRVDRIDPAKNIVGGFTAFRLLLQRHPALRERVTFLAVLSPSRQGSALYRCYKNDVLSLISSINAEFRTSQWVPILLKLGLEREVALAALQIFDVLVVNSTADGQNLVVKEASVLNSRDGIILLSRMTGAYAELGDRTLCVDPSDTEALVAAMRRAVSMEAAERRTMALACRRAVEEHPLSAWDAQQLAEIEEVASIALTTRGGNP